MTHLLKNNLTDITNHYRHGDISPVEITERCLEQISQHNPSLNAICFTDSQSSLNQAKKSEKRWQSRQPLSNIDGIPFTVKDLIYTAGWPTLHGSKTTATNQDWLHDAPCVARMKEAGAILIAKTTTPEFGHKGITTSPLHGDTINPWNTNKTPGGSSGGAAVAAATNMGLLHIGNDGGGSLRIPASFTGVFGFKPSPRLVPAWPVDDYIANQMSVTGPITRCVSDAAMIMDIISQPDNRDFTSLPQHSHSFTDKLNDPLKNLKIAYVSHVDDLENANETENILQSSLEHFKDIANITALKLDIPKGVFRIFWLASAQHIVNQFSETEQKKLDPSMRVWGELAKDITLTDYIQARADRLKIISTMNALLQNYDFILTPTTATTAFELGQDNPTQSDGQEWHNWSPFTSLVNLAQLPAASIPCGFTSDQLPVGLQIIGRNMGDSDVLRLSRYFEKKQPIELPQNY